MNLVSFRNDKREHGSAEKFMTTKRILTVAISLAAIALVGVTLLEICLGPRSHIAGFNRDMHARYEEITVGESKQAAVEALGKARAVSDEFNLPQRHGFERLFEAAERSSAVEYYQWINGMNWYYCIGFNSDGIVVIKGEGHS